MCFKNYLHIQNSLDTAINISIISMILIDLKFVGGRESPFLVYIGGNELSHIVRK
jgi:hypothetical protein